MRAAKITLGALVATAMVAAITHTSSSIPSVRAQLHDAAVPSGGWTAAWGAGMQPAVAGDDPNWSRKGFADQSVRQVVRVGAGGAEVRIRLSNAYGTRPLRVAGASVGRSAGGALVWPKTIKPVTFGHASKAVVPAGKELVSDPVPLSTSPLERLAVTMRFAAPTGPATFHRYAMTRSFRAPGDHLSDVGKDTFTESTASWYYLAGVEVAGRPVQGDPAGGSVVVFGDSLVDGVGSTLDADARFPDGLQERLIAARRPRGVVNAGIGTGKLLRDSACGGEKGLSRFGRDVLDRPGVRSVIVHLGANDIGAPEVDDPCVRPNPKVTAQQLIAGHRALIRAAHARGVKAIGMTILPMKGAFFPLWSPAGEKVRQAVNLWIRTGHEYDAVIDADKVMADPADPEMPRPGYVYMDGLHPNDAGYQALAAGVDLDQL
ncbi:SGNH/GDSL hydrolase family protein [Actinomadura darangshiensis]|uniref:SGNH/GDSL hydrolase family protein n=2 Tax=Actinomadura darangshiensis TaxID=705336 RepID=A0A4R5ADN9_9ACTN|nr:SGNH/GDSL hydrolase family protein [Actinomadura darangshiensis]